MSRIVLMLMFIGVGTLGNIATKVNQAYIDKTECRIRKAAVNIVTLVLWLTVLWFVSGYVIGTY